MSNASDIAEKIRTTTAGVDLADEASFEAIMEQIGQFLSQAETADGGLPEEVTAAMEAVMQAAMVASQKQMGLSDEDIALSDQMMADYRDMAEAERRDAPPAVLAVFDAIEEEDLEALGSALDLIDINVRFGDLGKTPLYDAMSGFEPSIELITLLLDRGADVNQGLNGNSNVLHGMAFGAYRDWPQEEVDALVARCVAAGGQLEARTEKLGWTPLHAAASEREKKVLHALLAGGADPNALMGVTDPPTFNNGGTTLQMVLSQPKLVELLLAFGADPLLPNAYGQTTIEAARNTAQNASDHGAGYARSLALMEARLALN